MKQIIQDIKNGNTILEDIPVPRINAESVLIKTKCSLVSLGTERMLVDFGKASYIQKARQQPEKVQLVLDKMRTDGIIPTLESVFNKLNQPIPLGYCNVGIIQEIGKNVKGFNLGDRVVSNGSHAEYVSVPQNLIAKVPISVSDEEATFTVIGAIGLQGIRLMKPTFGETIVVVGLGLVGLITAELLVANGCNVIGFDYDEDKVKIANSKGITAKKVSNDFDQVNFVKSVTNNIGADGIIITASSKSDKIISDSAKMCRKKGRVVLVGVVGLNISRADFYEKEIKFQVSCSYGPGRYDDRYEQKSYDYPIAYVRWTEQRNFEAVLNAIKKKNLDVKKLITNKVNLENFSTIYDNMDNSKSIASILIYKQDSKNDTSLQITKKTFTSNKSIVGVIGAGNFTGAVILPNLKKLDFQLAHIVSSNGLSSTVLAKKFSIQNSTTDYKQVLKDSNVDLVVIATRHNSHAKLVINSLLANKNIYVEKPLCIREDELDEIIKIYNKSKSSINIVFNRRFSPMAIKAKSLIGDNKEIPINISMTINAGYIPEDSWVHDMSVGGGRIIGEICHFIDLSTYLTSSKISKVCMNSLGNAIKDNTDNVSLLLKYKNGSNVTINYFSNGSKSYSKERIEVFFQNKTLVIDNWKKMHGYGFKKFKKISSYQNKGHYNQFKCLLNNQISNGGPIISFEEVVNTTRVTFAAIKSLIDNKWINIIND